jgi:hypothetical protein
MSFVVNCGRSVREIANDLEIDPNTFHHLKTVLFREREYASRQGGIV